MTAMLPLERIEVATECGRCRTPVITTISTRDGRRKTLDVTPVPGGQYRLDSRGRAVHRAVTDQVKELRSRHADEGGGYNVHDCRPR